MTGVVQDLILVVLIGAGATAVMDAWLALLKRAGVKTQSFAIIGRWVGHLWQGRLTHGSIASARPIQGELALGWLTHYTVGIAFAGLLVGIEGWTWTRAPTLLPALVLGVSTVVMPLFIMQPAMGAGFAASKTPTPLANCLRSVVNHTMFGLGLYLSALLAAQVSW